MVRVQQRLGNIYTDGPLRERVSAWQKEGILDEAVIDERDASKGRLRLQTGKGREVGISLPRGVKLEAGDVFMLEGTDDRLLVQLTLPEVMVLTPHPNKQTSEQMRWVIRLGHVLGNQHWPVAVHDEEVLVPVSLDRAVMETVLRTHHLLEHFSVRYEYRAWPKEEEPWTTHH
jgi:urease accessory protein